jgi:hypothetical protein
MVAPVVASAMVTVLLVPMVSVAPLAGVKVGVATVVIEPEPPHPETRSADARRQAIPRRMIVGSPWIFYGRREWPVQLATPNEDFRICTTSNSLSGVLWFQQTPRHASV